MTLFDTLRHDGKAEELFNEFPKQQNGSSFLTRASLHALAQLHQGLVEVIDSDKPQTRIFDIENDVNRNRHDKGKAKHMQPIAGLAASHARAHEQRTG